MKFVLAFRNSTRRVGILASNVAESYRGTWHRHTNVIVIVYTISSSNSPSLSAFIANELQMGPRGKQKQKQKQPDNSNEFSDALSREKHLTQATKDATLPQPRGTKVVPGIATDEKAQRKESITNATASKQKAVPLSSAEKQVHAESTATVPTKRSSGTRIKRLSGSTATAAIDPTQDGKKGKAETEEDADGLYGVFVQTHRCEELCSGLGLTLSDIRKMKRKYDSNDMYHSYV